MRGTQFKGVDGLANLCECLLGAWDWWWILLRILAAGGVTLRPRCFWSLDLPAHNTHTHTRTHFSTPSNPNKPIQSAQARWHPLLPRRRRSCSKGVIEEPDHGRPPQQRAEGSTAAAPQQPQPGGGGGDGERGGGGSGRAGGVRLEEEGEKQEDVVAGSWAVRGLRALHERIAGLWRAPAGRAGAGADSAHEPQAHGPHRGSSLQRAGLDVLLGLDRLLLPTGPCPCLCVCVTRVVGLAPSHMDPHPTIHHPQHNGRSSSTIAVKPP